MSAHRHNESPQGRRISHPLLCNKLPQTQQPRTTCIYHLAVFVGQQSNTAELGRLAQGLSQATIKLRARVAVSCEDLTGGAAHCQARSYGCPQATVPPWLLGSLHSLLREPYPGHLTVHS